MSTSPPSTTLLSQLLHPNLPVFLSLLALLPLAYFYTAHASSTLFPSLRSQRILLLTAHPDDETMFFAPTVQALTRPELGNHLKILCLSNGGKDGLGGVRRRELGVAAGLLGVGGGGVGNTGGGTDEHEGSGSGFGAGGDVLCLDDPQLQDGDPWSTPYITSLLLRTFAPSFSSPSPSSSSSTTKSTTKSQSQPRPQQQQQPPPETTIDVLITFDSHGVSSHPNHMSCHAAALAFHDALMSGDQASPTTASSATSTSTSIFANSRPKQPVSTWSPPLSIYNLKSVSLPRKYSSILDVFASVLLSLLTILNPFSSLSKNNPSTTSSGAKRNTKTWPSHLLYVSGPTEWWNGVRAMVRGHRSQMVWFRWGWVGVGRYMVVNELGRVR